MPFVFGVIAVLLALLLALVPIGRRSVPSQLAAVIVAAMLVTTYLGWVSYDVYRPLGASAVALALVVPVMAWRRDETRKRSLGTTVALAGLLILSMFALVDATGITELLTGYMPGIGICDVFGWYPAVPFYCFRSTLFPLLAAGGVCLVTLIVTGRRNRTAVRFSLVSGLLVAASFLTRNVSECQAEPASATSALFNKGLQTDGPLPPSSVGPRC